MLRPSEGFMIFIAGLYKSRASGLLNFVKCRTIEKNERGWVCGAYG